MPGRVNKMHLKHIYSTFQSISVQTQQSLMLIDFNFAKTGNTQIDPHWLLLPVAHTVRWLRVKTQLVRMGHVCPSNVYIIISKISLQCWLPFCLH